MKILSFLWVFLVPLHSFNISNISDYKKMNIISPTSKIVKSYFLSKHLENQKSIKEDIDINNQEPSNDNNNSELENSIYFYSNIDEQSSLELERKLILLEKHNQRLLNVHNINRGPIHLHIQSFGGSLLHTLYLIDLIKNMKTPVYTYVDGFAASAGTLLSVVGKKRFISKHSLMLIHQLSGGASGKYSELKDEEQNIDMFMDMIINIYLEHTNINEDTLRNILNHDWWLNSQQCLKYGLVDEIK